jgi:hypothetical protein
MTISIEDIEALRRVLAELPRHQPKEVSKQEAIALLASELGTARRRGYKPDELARILSERGVAINAPTLRGYLRRNRRSRGKQEGKTESQPGGSTMPSPTQAGDGRGSRPATATTTSPPPPPRARETSDATALSRPPLPAQAIGVSGTKVTPGASDGREPQIPRR